MNLTELSARLTECYSLEARDAGAGFYQLWDVASGDLLLHVRGWEFFMQAIRRNLGSIRMRNIETEEAEIFAIPDYEKILRARLWEEAYTELIQTPNGIFVCLIDGEVVFAATSWEQAWELFVLNFGEDLTARVMTEN